MRCKIDFNQRRNHLGYKVTSVKKKNVANFIAGICEWLISDHPRSPIGFTPLDDVPEPVEAQNAISTHDDKQIINISEEW